MLRGLSIEVPDGDIVALLGSNGAGKTTTARAITGLLEVHDGKVTKGVGHLQRWRAPLGLARRLSCGRASAR